MSRFNLVIDGRCPKCNAPIDAELCAITMRQSGEIMEFECNACKEIVQVENPLNFK